VKSAQARKSKSKTVARKALLRLTRKRLERFVSMVPKFLVNDDPKLVHDLRVRSRRLQQTLRVALPRPKPRGARKVVKALRAVRQALGPCRNLDVNLALARKRAESSQAPAREAWNALASDLSGERPAVLDQARRLVGKQDLVSFIGRVQAALDQVDHTEDPLADMNRSLGESLAEWDEAYAQADRKRETEELHALRIAGKRLRYRAELLADVGITVFQPMTEDLKQMQGVLGNWHDGTVLAQCMAEFVRRANFVEHHPELAAALLLQMEEEQKRGGKLIDEFFNDAPARRRRWRPGRSGKRERRVDDQKPLRATTRSTRARRSSKTSSTDGEASIVSNP
jgi:CHAD domain-containing protein